MCVYACTHAFSVTHNFQVGSKWTSIVFLAAMVNKDESMKSVKKPPVGNWDWNPCPHAGSYLSESARVSLGYFLPVL